MLSAMKIFTTDKQKAELEHLHDSSRDKCVCDRGLSDDRASSASARNHGKPTYHDYINTRKLKPKNGGSASRLNIENKSILISHLYRHLLNHTHDIVAYVEQRWAIRSVFPV